MVTRTGCEVGFSSVVAIAAVAALCGDGGLVAHVAHGFEDVGDGTPVGVEADVGPADADGVYFNAIEGTERLLHPGHAVPTRHPADRKVESLHG
jgi:hypothetical protein